MKIKEILSRECVQADLQSTNKEAVIHELACLVAKAHPSVSADQIALVLLEREKLGSTGIGNGVAIPHGKLAGITEIIAGFGRSVAGVPFDAQDGHPSQLFFILIAPENAASMHLKALARLSRLLKDSNFRNTLLASTSEDHLYQTIILEDEKV